MNTAGKLPFNNTTPFPATAPGTNLLQAEVDILSLVAEGQSDTEIAQTLKISRHTVNMRMRNAFRKLGVNNRVVAVVKALQQGIITPPPGI